MNQPSAGKNDLMKNSPARLDTRKAVVWEKRNQNAHGDADLIQADLKNALVLVEKRLYNFNKMRLGIRLYHNTILPLSSGLDISEM